MKSDSIFEGNDALGVRSAIWSRRRFVKIFVVGTAFSRLAGRNWFATVVADCVPSVTTAGILRVRVSEFPALQSDDGSVRLLFNAINPITRLPANSGFYPVLINRASASQFFALNSRCTHEFCVVPPFDAAAQGSVCPCHGSIFAIDGRLIEGARPGQASLSKLLLTFDGVDLLCIEIPNLGYSVTGSDLQSSVGPRFRLQFPTKSNLKYQVRFHQSAADAGAVVPFSTTETGAVTPTVLTGNNLTATVYVDRTNDTGFYTVAVQVSAG